MQLYGVEGVYELKNKGIELIPEIEELVEYIAEFTGWSTRATLPRSCGSVPPAGHICSCQ